jgi:SAM-dependent methyltransferase
MNQPPALTDRKQLDRQRARAAANPALFLQEDAALEIHERLLEVNRQFTRVAIITPFPKIWGEFIPNATYVHDTDRLDLAVGQYDLVIHSMSLHWANDPVGQLVQCRRALRPDGMCIVAAFGGQTLSELRASLAEAEIAVTGGLSPRVAPMGEIRDLGGLLQRAGFALPVADGAHKTVTYSDALHLMRDLRAMAEGNAVVDRRKTPMSRRLFMETAKRYADAFGTDDGRIPATFETIFLTGWAPDESQQKPLRPGSAKTRLADALSTTETSLPKF